MFCGISLEFFMKVFISWSGARSRAVAVLLSDWIKCVIQATRPWISTRDIDRGALWFTEIGDQLRDTTVGIVCLTHENKNKPWILFETGALAKGLSSSRVCTFLVDLTPADLEDPLAQFNHTLPTKDGVWQLVRTLNNSLGDGGLEERILDSVFSTYWIEFETKFKAILKETPAQEKAEPRSDKNLLGEILENTRFLSNRIRTLEAKVEKDDDLRNARRNQMNLISADVLAANVLEMARVGVPKDTIVRNISKDYGLTIDMASNFVSNILRESAFGKDA